MRQNPYILLGIPFGSSREEANVAFARKTKPLRRAKSQEARDQLTELTWALNQVDEGLIKPSSAMSIYRIPANPAALDQTGPGALLPGPEVLPPAAGVSRSDAAKQLQQEAGLELLRYLILVRADQIGNVAP